MWQLYTPYCLCLLCVGVCLCLYLCVYVYVFMFIECGSVAIEGPLTSQMHPPEALVKSNRVILSSCLLIQA